VAWAGRYARVLRLAVAVALLAATAACETQVAGHGTPAAGAPPPATPTASGTATPGGTGSSGPVRLRVQVYGSLGMRQANLFQRYRQEHPNVSIEFTETTEVFSYWPKVLTQLASGNVADVYAVEATHIGEVVHDRADNWTDLSQFGARDQAGDYPDSIWRAASTPAGAVYGLGYDAGPMAICYRRDLLARAGLPTDRIQLARAWRSWPAYLDMARRYAGGGRSFFADSAQGLFRAMLGGAGAQFYDASGKPGYATNPAVKRAWDAAAAAIRSGVVGRTAQFRVEWMRGIEAGRYATMPCPYWMLGLIKAQSPQPRAGTWDVAAPPGPADWGGGYLAVPRASEHAREAYDLISWLTAAPQQAAVVAAQPSLFPARISAATAVPQANRHPARASQSEPGRPVRRRQRPPRGATLASCLPPSGSMWAEHRIASSARDIARGLWPAMSVGTVGVRRG